MYSVQTPMNPQSDYRIQPHYYKPPGDLQVDRKVYITQSMIKLDSMKHSWLTKIKIISNGETIDFRLLSNSKIFGLCAF